MPLISKLKKGDTKALELLYLKYHKRLYLLAYRFTSNESESQDLVHDIIVKLYLHRHKLSEEVSIEAQLIRIAKSLIIDHIKKRKEVPLEVIQHSEIQTIESEISLNKQRSLFKKALEELPDQCKEIFKLHKIEGLTYSEIATYKHISEKTVENQISKAYKILRNHLQSNYL